MKKIFLLLFLLSLFVFPTFVWGSDVTLNNFPATFAVDTSASSPQYINGVDTSVLQTVDDATLTSSLLSTTLDLVVPTFVFEVNTGGYTLPDNEDFKSLKANLVYKTNVGSLASHRVVVKFINSSGTRVTCLDRHDLTIPSTSGSYVTEQFSIDSCRNGRSLGVIEIYYFANALVQPVNTSFDYVGVSVEHGNKTENVSSGSTAPETVYSKFAKGVDVTSDGGMLEREGNSIKLLFGKNSLPYEASVTTENVVRSLLSLPGKVVGNIYKLSVFASFNGYPLTKFNPAMIFMSFPACSGRPVVQTSQDGKNWKSLFSVRLYSPSNMVAAVITSPGYYLVSCQ